MKSPHYHKTVRHRRHQRHRQPTVGITKRRLRSGGAIDAIRKHVVTPGINYVSSLVPTPMGMAFGVYDRTRALKDLIKNANQAYNFFKHCESIYGSGAGKHRSRIEVWQRYRAALDDLNKILKAVFNNVFMTKVIAATTKSPDIREHMEKFEMNVGEFSLLHDMYKSVPAGVISKLLTPAMIVLYPDWYRYELNILTTNLLTMISEVNMGLVKTKTS